MKTDDDLIKDGLVSLLQIGDRINVVKYFKGSSSSYCSKEVHNRNIVDIKMFTVHVFDPSTSKNRIVISKCDIKYRPEFGLYVVLKYYI